MKAISLNAKKIKEFFVSKSNIKYIMLALITVVYLFLFLIPKIKDVFLNLTEASQLKGEVVNIEKEWKNLDLLKKQASHLNEKIDYYEKKLPSEKDIPTILEYLSESAKELAVRITEIKPIEEQQDKDKAAPVSLYYKVPILLKAECGYHQLGRFLNKLENADRFMKISDIEIAANPRKTNIHYVQLVVLTYVMEK